MSTRSEAHDAESGHRHGAAGAHGPDAAEGLGVHADAKVRDPVCGMSVDPHTTSHRQSHQGRTYYFCSAGCRAKFSADPHKYVGPTAGKVPADRLPEGTIYTCPMHPE